MSNRRGTVILFLLLLSTSLSRSQKKVAVEPEPGYRLRVTTRLVLVDVVAKDRAGRSVIGLKREDFRVLDAGKEQAIAFFEEEGTTAAQAPARALPENYYSNRPEYRAAPGPATILLLDFLNTPPADQAYARNTVLRYLTQHYREPGPLALLLLTTRLTVIKDFNADPDALRSALAMQKPGVSPFLESPEQDSSVLIGALPREAPSEARAAADSIARSIHELDQNSVDSATDVRATTTLRALRSIARALAGHPGRKNLVWISAAFPLALLPDLQGNSYSFPRNFAQDMRLTANQLAEAGTAIYPIYARGLVPDMTDASAGAPSNMRLELSLFGSTSTMLQLAQETGGLAFFNRNDLGRAIELSVEHGSHYYRLGYYPSNHDWDGRFRSLDVKAPAELKIYCREGYYAWDQSDSSRLGPMSSQELLDIISKDPLPDTMVTFFVHVAPPLAGRPGPVSTDFSVDAASISFRSVGRDRHYCRLEFHVVALSPAGAVVAREDRLFSGELDAKGYRQVVKGGLPFQLSLNLAPGSYKLRVAVRDSRSGNLGTLEVPVMVSRAMTP